MLPGEGNEPAIERTAILDHGNQSVKRSDKMRRDHVLGGIGGRTTYRKLSGNLGGLSVLYGIRRRPSYLEGLVVGSGIGILGSSILEWLGVWVWLAAMIAR